ncbi:MAG TPA: hypothetical protein VN903_13005 [Polyangia bacterium]|nr:hypothetical protein [Polyangia bacterium]
MRARRTGRAAAVLLIAATMATASCGPADCKQIYGSLPYPTPTAGSLTQSVALESGQAYPNSAVQKDCLTYAQVHCVAEGQVGSITFWQYCLNDPTWKMLPGDTYTLVGTLCEFHPTINGQPANARCIQATCTNPPNCQVTGSQLNGITEESYCASHENGSAAGAVDTVWTKC